MKRFFAISLLASSALGLFSSSAQATSFEEHFLWENQGGIVTGVYKVNPEEIACTRMFGNNYCSTQASLASGLTLQQYPAGYFPHDKKVQLEKIAKFLFKK